MNEKGIFDFDADLEKITKLVAELFDFRWIQFHVCVESNKKLKDAIMRYNISFYQDNIERLNKLPDSRKFFEKAKLYKVLNLTQEELTILVEKMDNMYYK